MTNRSLWMSCIVVAVGLVGCARVPYQPLTPGPSLAVRRAAERIEYGQANLSGARGTQLFEQWWRPKSETATVGTLVVVHGLKDHGTRYADFAERAAEQGFAVYTFDLRGHAHSEGDRVFVEAFEDYVKDVETVLSSLTAKADNKPVFLFGHSMGGAIVTLYALEHPKTLTGLIVQAGALETDVGWVKRTGTRFLSWASPRAEVFQLELEDFSRDPETVRQAKADPLIYAPAAPARTARELLLAIARIDEQMEALEVPLLVLHGEADTVTSPEGSKALVARAKSEDKTLKLYPGLAHDLMHEPEREKVMRDVLAWLQAHLEPDTGGVGGSGPAAGF